MKIAIITSGILPVPAVQGGAVENLIDYALEYNNQHHLHDITVYSAYNKRVLEHPALQSSVNHYKYIKTHSIFFRLFAKLYFYVDNHCYYHHQIEFFFERIWKDIRKQKYDLIILENRPAFANKLSYRTQIPIISHIHTDLLFEPSLVNQRIVRATYRFLSVSDYIKKEIMKVGVGCDIRTVYNGLDTSVFHRISNSETTRFSLGFKDEDFIAVFWGRLVPKKGIKELLQAMELLNEEKGIKLLVIGSINYEDTQNQTNPFIEELKQIANHIPEKVVFTGFVPYSKIAQHLSLANVAVIPSRINEAFGMTCIEACALGLPVIATNDGGIPETLVSQKHIIIDKDGDIPQQLKDSILKVKHDSVSYQGNRLNPLFMKESFCHSFFDNIK